MGVVLPGEADAVLVRVRISMRHQDGCAGREWEERWDVRVTMASAAARTGRTNEDSVGATATAAVLIDGAGIPGTEAICRHGVAWCTHLAEA
jgi:hypothetical protein